MSITTAMHGMSIIACAIDPKTPEDFGSISALILTGHYDLPIKAAAYYRIVGKVYETEEELNRPDVITFLDGLKAMVRNTIEFIFTDADEQLKNESKESFDNLRKKLCESNKPHVQGTVAELAQKLGVSKSEVRRMKTEGTLEKALQEHSYQQWKTTDKELFS